jgi:adenosylcobinamide-GDP ribazoletransferase
VPIADEVRAALGAVTGLHGLAPDAGRAARVGALVFFPPLGAALGLVAAAAARLATPLGSLAAALAAIGTVALLGGGQTVRDLARVGWGAIAVVLPVKVAAVAWLPADARLFALPLACMLGRWAVVVQCYGGRPAGVPDGASADLVGRARLREFGWASAVAFAATLALLDAVGLVVLLAAILVTVAVRLLVYRRLGGITGPALGATTELVETTVLLVLAALARG